MSSTRSRDRELIATTSSLVEFLRDVALVRHSRITDVSEYETVLWLNDLPREVSVNVNAGPGEALFAISRLRAEAPPEPPAALTGWLDRAALTDSAQPSPVLRDSGPAWVVVEKPNGGKAMTAQVLPLAKAPNVGEAFENWLPLWHAWAVRDRRAAPFRQWYTTMAAAAHLVSQQEDQYELVLGTALLAWRAPSGIELRNHILTTRLTAVVDSERDEVRVVVDAEAATRTQDRELLDGEAGYLASRVESVHDQVRDGGVVAPLVDCEPLAQAWAQRALDVETPFLTEWAPKQRVEANAELRLAPAIVVRRRERGSLIGYYDAMLRELRRPNAQAPLGLTQLVTAMEASERLAWLAESSTVVSSGEQAPPGEPVHPVVAAAAVGADGAVETAGAAKAAETAGAAEAAETAGAAGMLAGETLFPLPANPEQLRIMARLRGNNGVVVQGPPGTGKTHTIANLMCALLAQGQRVLVTSQKVQALRVLRDKLPAEVTKLCVSMTDLDRGGSAELESSVKAMSNQYAGFDPVHHAEKVNRTEQRRAELAARVDALTDQVRQLRESETRPHPAVAPGYEGTLGEITRRLRERAARYGWMPVPVPDANAPAPLSAVEAGELARLLRTQTPQRMARISEQLVNVDDYRAPDQVRAMIVAEAAAREAAERSSTEISRRLDTCDASTLRSLQTAIDGAHQSASLLGLELDTTQWPTDDWVVRAIADGLSGQNANIWAQLAAGRDQVETAQRAVLALGFRQVVIAASAPGTASAQIGLVAPLRAHLAGGGKLRGTFKSGVQRDAEAVLDHATVDGLPVSTSDQVMLVAAALEALAGVEQIGRGWSMVGVNLAGSPTEPVQRAVARLADMYPRLHLVHRFLGSVHSVRQTLAGAQAWLPLMDLGDWQEFVGALAGVRLRMEAEQATAALAAVSEQLTVAARAHAMPPEIGQAATAVLDRDADAYARALASLAEAAQQQADQVACDALAERLRPVHPALAALLTETAGDAAWPTRLADWDAAWAWCQASTFFVNQRQPGREQQLEAELTDTIARLRKETAELAAARAWGHCLRRMTAHQAQALQAYEQHMRAVGKGTGRYASRFRGLAREAMREARDAVPAWIMPLDVVLETLAPVRDSFDVVIVDEASQAGLEDLFLLWLAPRVIVVGDDKQCAPSQVRLGELEPIFAKLSSYLPELPAYLRDAFTPKSSLFDLLRTRFGAVIPLREHFRCMPEIIEYSSRQFYADEPLVPLRQFGGERLAPLRSVRVRGAATEGTATRLRNPVEAEAIVAQIEACLADRAYRGKTFGVVVMQGAGQVQLLHQLLLERIEPKEWDRRRLRVGTPPDFQGDERDVVFVSLVVAEKRPAVTGTEWQRRFNVAASRAKDQMWLFHSVGPEELSSNDLRSSLLSYVLNPPPALATAVLTDVTADEPHPSFRSSFDQQVFLRIRERGFHVTPAFEVGGRKIDLVVTGAKGRLAVECDGQDWPGTEEQREQDLDRERELKRAGWRFWRVRESEFHYDPDAALTTLWETLSRYGIRPYDPTEAVSSAATATVWRPAPLSTVEGWDGLEDGEPAELDDIRLTTMVGSTTLNRRSRR